MARLEFIMSNDLSAAAPQSLAQVVARNAEQIPSKIAFISDKKSLSWRQYQYYSDALCAALMVQNFNRGAKIGIFLPDSNDLHIALVACERAGLVAVGISARAGLSEINHLLNTACAVGLISHANHYAEVVSTAVDSLSSATPIKTHIQFQDGDAQPSWAVLSGVVPASMGAPAVVDAQPLSVSELFLLNSTSGSTGLPKCVMQNQARWFAFAAYARKAAPLSKDDVFLCAVPGTMGFGLWSGHFAPAVLGATTILLPKFSTSALLDAIQTYRVTVLAAVSTQFIMLLNDADLARYDLSSLKVLFTGGEPVSYEKACQFEEATGAYVLQFYGSNEAGALSYTSVNDTREQRLRTAGRIIDEMHVRLIDERANLVLIPGRGQPICKGPMLSMGYFNNDAENSELFMADGSIKLGDIVDIDAQGYLRVIGRVGDFIIRGGKNISAALVEKSLLAHADIRMAAAVAMPDTVFGEKVCAFLVLAAGKNLSLQDVQNFMIGQGISKEYFPERIIIVDELPLVSGGKVAKKILSERLKKYLKV
jgi:acyl-CoA synthetase